MNSKMARLFTCLVSMTVYSVVFADPTGIAWTVFVNCSDKRVMTYCRLTAESSDGAGGLNAVNHTCRLKQKPPIAGATYSTVKQKQIMNVPIERGAPYFATLVNQYNSPKADVEYCSEQLPGISTGVWYTMFHHWTGWTNQHIFMPGWEHCETFPPPNGGGPGGGLQ